MERNSNKVQLAILLLLVGTIITLGPSPAALAGAGAAAAAAATAGQPDESCVAPLTALLDCLPYAQGKTPSPTPTCCANVGKVYASQKKCLCELIASSFQDAATTGLPSFNRTVALHMPAACDVPADPAKCVGLLGLSPSSQEAKEFDSASPKASGTSLVSPDTSSNTPASKNPITMKSSASMLVFGKLFSLNLVIVGILVLVLRDPI